MTVQELFWEDQEIITKSTILIDQENDMVALIRPYTHRSPKIERHFQSWLQAEVLDRKLSTEDRYNPVWYIKVKKALTKANDGDTIKP